MRVFTRIIRVVSCTIDNAIVNTVCALDIDNDTNNVTRSAFKPRARQKQHTEVVNYCKKKTKNNRRSCTKTKKKYTDLNRFAEYN